MLSMLSAYTICPAKHRGITRAINGNGSKNAQIPMTTEKNNVPKMASDPMTMMSLINVNPIGQATTIVVTAQVADINSAMLIDLKG